ncbi:hypothetical protein E6C60_2995 [Paenibacillus algicola]|uniref:Uncharacterized protein n=1 Tax=Paenibacillus algicola TaxID=2565926 RepID=A0A4P8XLR8_9BACL|nr:hypothetical protein E6C60_2995 [Paenibacillus algicola]
MVPPIYGMKDVTKGSGFGRIVDAMKLNEQLRNAAASTK